MSKETASKKHFRNLYQFMSICLQLADMADEKQESPFDNCLHMGYRAFSEYMRGGVKEIIDLQNDFYNMAFKAEFAQRDADDARDFLQHALETGKLTQSTRTIEKGSSPSATRLDRNGKATEQNNESKVEM